MYGPIYWAPDVSASEAKGHPIFAAIQHAGPWSYATHPQGGTLAFWTDHPRSLSDYEEPREVSQGLHYHAPKAMPTLYELVKDSTKGGVDLTLACGLVVTVPVALLESSHFRLSRNAKRHGDPMTEYGRLSAQLLDQAKSNGDKGIPDDDAGLLRLIELAIGQRYRVTAELLDDLQIIAQEDIDPIMGTVWYGDPKTFAPASAGEASALPTSASTGAK